jgi:N6-adenosine-specific RNA methylase IME4
VVALVGMYLDIYRWHDIFLTSGASPCSSLSRTACASGDPPSVIFAPRRKHSEKHDVFAEMIEQMFPNVPKLEMFARKPRDGWDVWGNEI